MGIFTREKVVVDVLQEWRKIEVGGGFNMFDKVLVKKYSGQEKVGVIGGKFRDGYLLITYQDGGSECKNGFDNMKHYYGEFQKEMEALDESKKKMEEVEELSKKLVKAKQEAEELYKVGKKIVELNVSKQFIL